jgi:hypothetical protein
MNRISSLFLLIFCSTVATTPAQNRVPASSVAFFVATNGNDSWSGQISMPFATLPRALQAVRDWRGKQTNADSSTATIYLRKGIYFLQKPLSILPEDSGLTVSAFRNENPILSGGRRIGPWKETTVDGRKLWVADVPGVSEGKWMFRELWINNQRAVRARHPNKGYFSVAELPDKTAEWTQGQARFSFREGDLKAWNTITNAEVVAMTKWVESRLPVLAVDESTHTINFSKRSVFQLAQGDPYYLEGALEVLDEPGEWCLVPSAGKIFYLPLQGEKPDQIEAIAPALAQVVRLEGHPEQNQFIERLTMKGLKFAHTEWYFPAGNPPPSQDKMEVGGFSQAAIGVPGAVWGEGIHNCTFENCAFSNLGNYGLELARGCQSNRISHCEFSDLGGGGVKIGEPAIRETSSEQARANEISNCNIHDGGKVFLSAIGVWLGQSPDNRISHNLIHDFYYTGISIGWTWGYGNALASNNLVEFNHVHHIGIKSDGDGPVLSDMGGIYTLGKQPGTRIINNLWHDIAAIRYGGWGIYFDEGSSGILAQSNLVCRTTHGGFHQHYGETNVVWNNIFAFARDHQLQRSRVEPHQSFSFATNIVYFDTGTLLTSEWGDNHFQMDWNVFFDARPDSKPDSLLFGKATLEAWHARGHDRNSIVADPLFTAPQKNNFHLQPNSPALKLGFQPIDLSSVGIRRILKPQLKLPD